MKVTLTVNGAEHTVDVEPRLLLVHLIREELELTGTHIGCDTTSCGACTVLLDGTPVKSCTLFGVQAEGRSITTVEGLLEGGALAPIQAAFKEHHGLQCGYCTPGMMLVGSALIEENPDPSDDDVRHAISGNICRCTGYMNIVTAIRGRREGERRRYRERERLREGAEHTMATQSEEIRGVGHSVRRVEDDRLIQGRGNFIDDINLKGQLYMAILRSPWAHATLERHRLVGSLGAARRGRGRHRRADGPAQPRVDADPVGRYAGRARDRQGALPGTGGRRGDRDRPLHRQGRAAADRRGLRPARSDRDAAARAGGRRAADPRREGRANRQPHLRLGGRRQGGNRRGLRRVRTRWSAWTPSTRGATPHRSRRAAASPTSIRSRAR